jgi:hypothetical protein
MGEINVIFGGSLSIASKTHEKKLKREISLAQRIKPERRMKSSNVHISFGLEDHPKTELSEWNLPFVVKTFIEMGLSLAKLTPIYDMFHGVIPGHSSTSIGHIDLEVSYETGDNKHREMLMFEIASFDIGYNYILGRHFLLKFMTVIHTVYATMKMPGPKGVLTIKADQWDALACENASLSHVDRFGEKATQQQLAKMAKTQGGSTPLKTSVTKLPIGDLSDLDKKLHISTCLDTK